jgi:hypothetical protein
VGEPRGRPLRGGRGVGRGPPVEVYHGTKKVSPPPASAGVPEPRVVPRAARRPPHPGPSRSPHPLCPRPLPRRSCPKPRRKRLLSFTSRAGCGARAGAANGAPRADGRGSSRAGAAAEPVAPARPATDWTLAGAVVVGLLFAAVVLRRPAAAPTTVVLPPAPPAPPVRRPTVAELPLPLAEEVPETLTSRSRRRPPPKTAQKFDAARPSKREEAQRRAGREQGARC